MKKILLALLSLILIACQTDSNIGVKQPASVSVLYRDPIDQEISMGEISIILPLAWIKQEAGSDNVSYINRNKRNLVLLNRENCPMTSNQCMIFTLSGIMQSEMEILSVEGTIVNNNEFIHIVSRKDQVKIWSWIAYRNSNLYMLSCGGMEEDLANQEICVKIASSIKLQ